MQRYLNALLLVLSLYLGLADVHAAAPSNSWKDDEMNPRPKPDDNNDKKIKDISCGAGCEFDLHYFRGKNAPGKPNILFISGGPGHIEQREPRRQSLDYLEDKYNVFYFDIRGAGFSSIQVDNKFDTALRAKHVVDDIEQIRIAELGEATAWDAVYGHSHGTIVAQRYAKSSPNGRPKLKKLILSAPLYRVKDFEKDRIDMLVNNLKSIFENYRQQTAGQQCPPGAPPMPGDPAPIKGTDNFCFLSTGSDGMVDKLVSKLKRKLTDLSGQFGSIGFVAEYFDKITEEEPDALKFPSKLPYPKFFYNALQRLSFLGGTEPDPLQAADWVREVRVNAAFMLGYYLNLDEEIDFKPDAHLNPDLCQRDAPFFNGVTNGAGNDQWKRAFCRRFLIAVTMLNDMEDEIAGSKRANTVYGLNDGILPSILTILNVRPTSCIASKEVKDFADDSNDKHKGARAVLRRVGVDLSEQICFWNPEEHAHDISTLILKGGADPIISGCQAETVFTKGLTGERVLIEFPGVGHLMQLPNFAATGTKTDGMTALSTLVDTFLKKTPADFNNDSAVKKLKADFQLTIRTATEPGGADICPH